MVETDNISSREFLGDLLKGVYGQITFSTKKFGCEDLFESLNDRVLYFNARLSQSNGLAINETTCMRYIELTKRALNGELKTLNGVEISSNLADVLDRLFEVDLSSFRFSYMDATILREQKKAGLLSVLSAIMRLFIGKTNVPKELAKKTGDTACQLARSEIEPHQNRWMPYGIGTFYFNVAEVKYPSKIELVHSNLDIVHFHGLSWTNQNREFLLDALCRKNLDIRVSLLDPKSPFYLPYAEFIGVTGSYLKEKTDEVIGIWKQLQEKARSAKNGTAKFKLVLSRSFPAKAMYRFDDTIVVTPTTNAKPKAQFMAYECSNTGPGSKDAYNIYRSEIEWLMNTGKAVLGSDFFLG